MVLRQLKEFKDTKCIGDKDGGWKLGQDTFWIEGSGKISVMR